MDPQYKTHRDVQVAAKLDGCWTCSIFASFSAVDTDWQGEKPATEPTAQEPTRWSGSHSRHKAESRCNMLSGQRFGVVELDKAHTLCCTEEPFAFVACLQFL
jgi:hypothetical protein